MWRKSFITCCLIFFRLLKVFDFHRNLMQFEAGGVVWPWLSSNENYFNMATNIIKTTTLQQTCNKKFHWDKTLQFRKKNRRGGKHDLIKKRSKIILTFTLIHQSMKNGVTTKWLCKKVLKQSVVRLAQHAISSVDHH